MASTRTVKQCLEAVGLVMDDFSECVSLDEEFSIVKKAYFKTVLKTHPDKGGDPEQFRRVQTSFEVLRDLFDAKKISSFVSDCDTTAQEFGDMWKNFDGMPTPSWEFFYAAAESTVPTYRVEPAKSGRSTCKAMGSAKQCETEGTIQKNELRCGYLDTATGTYTGWKHLECWRVPSKVWMGLPDPDTCTDELKFETAIVGMNEVLLCGFSELSGEQQSKVIQVMMDRSNWAVYRKRSKKQASPNLNKYHKSMGAESSRGDSSSSDGSHSRTHSNDVAKKHSDGTLVKQGHHAPRQYFVAPEPGKNGAVANSLAGQTFVMTGVFPELGGGVGLSLGKAKLKQLISSFGGRVTGSVSGKTDVLVVGKNPGFSKVSKAREKPKVKMMSVKTLKEILEGGSLEDAEAAPMLITNFSSGYGNNSAATRATANQLAIAQGTQAPALEDTLVSPKKKRKKPTLSRKTAASKGTRKKRLESVKKDIKREEPRQEEKVVVTKRRRHASIEKRVKQEEAVTQEKIVATKRRMSSRTSTTSSRARKKRMVSF